MADSPSRLLPFVAHFAFWLPYIVRGQVDRMRGRIDGEPVHASPRAKLLVGQHAIAVIGMYLGLGHGVYSTPNGVDTGLQGWVGAALIAVGGGVSLWTLWVFRSWRLRAELGADHELCTDGPFTLVRHPIYTAMVLLAFGTAIWVPNGLTIGAILGIAWVGDQRARAEEALLLTAFGERYRQFVGRTRRFIPGIY